MSLELIFLGTGTSAGVPMIGCSCEVCRSPDPRDRRSRPSALVRYDDGSAQESTPGYAPTVRQILIDTAPELRQQVIRHAIDRIDAVLFTHCHADHIFGLDDLRRFNVVMKAPLDIYAEEHVLDRLRQIFSYIFEPHPQVNPSFVAQLIPHQFEVGAPLDLFGARWTPIRLLHGPLPIIGLRVDHDGHSLAYCTDVSEIPPEAHALLAGLDVLVLDALRYRHHPTHFNVDQALEQIDKIQPGRAYLTHIAHDICHAELEAKLPAHIFLSFDGLSVDVPTSNLRCPSTGSATRPQTPASTGPKGG